MRQVHLNLHGGIAGDMLVAGLLDAGAPREVLDEVLAALPAGEFRVEVGRERRRGLVGLRFSVEVLEAPAHRGLAEVLELLAPLPLSERARGWAEASFHALAEAEAEVHGASPDSVHFHEVGAVDAVVDVAAACALLDALEPEAVFATAVPVGSGTVRSAHGELPVPAPATALLLRGMPTCGADLVGERATPTGVALLRGVGVRFEPRPPAVLEAVGHGLGARDPEDRVNLLRVEVERVAVGQEWVVEFRTLVDHLTGEELGRALDELRPLAVDLWAEPALGKKGRPAWEVVVLAEAEHEAVVRDAAFRTLRTLGFRVRPLRRERLPRVEGERATPFGPLRTKVAIGPDAVVARPEADDLTAAAEERGLTLQEFLAELARRGREA